MGTPERKGVSRVSIVTSGLDALSLLPLETGALPVSCCKNFLYAPLVNVDHGLKFEQLLLTAAIARAFVPGSNSC